MRGRIASGIAGIVVGLLLAICPFEAAAKREPLVKPAEPEAVAQPADQSAAGDDEKKDRLATAAVFLFALVVIACGVLLIGVLLWGRRVRRVARTRTPAVSPGDELWYLKPSKSNAPTTREQQSLPPAEPEPNDGNR